MAGAHGRARAHKGRPEGWVRESGPWQGHGQSLWRLPRTAHLF